jgi:hypothetical protein
MTQTREALVELMARAICKVNEVSDDVFTEQPLHNRWIEDAAAALLALEAAGVRQVPSEATADQREAGMPWIEADSAVYASDGAAKAYRAMIAASPYAKDTP